MAKSYSVEFHMKAIALGRAGKSIADIAQELGRRMVNLLPRCDHSIPQGLLGGVKTFEP